MKINCSSVVLTTGTFLRGMIRLGDIKALRLAELETNRQYALAKKIENLKVFNR